MLVQHWTPHHPVHEVFADQRDEPRLALQRLEERYAERGRGEARPDGGREPVKPPRLATALDRPHLDPPADRGRSIRRSTAPTRLAADGARLRFVGAPPFACRVAVAHS